MEENEALGDDKEEGIEHVEKARGEVITGTLNSLQRNRKKYHWTTQILVTLSDKRAQSELLQLGGMIMAQKQV